MHPNNYCDCPQDGHCPRYNRPMQGRMRELCAGINVDLGTAAAFREQWAREAGADAHTPPSASVQPVDCIPTEASPRRLLLKTGQAPGDAVAMTASIYSLHKAYPGKYLTSVESYWPDVFAYNPDVADHSLPDPDNPALPDGTAEVRMHYPAIHASNDRAIHFMQAWCEFLGAALGISLPLLTNRPRLYFPADGPVPPVEDFWLVCSGGKRDFTNKLWGTHNYQKVINLLRKETTFVQVGGARPSVPWDASCAGSQEDSHPRLTGVVDMVGKTSLRELFDLARRAKGILCGVSLLMHVAAALGKPAVVVAGGREPVAWNAYPLQQYVHTIGATDCRDTRGATGGACWRARVLPLGDAAGKAGLDADPCCRPVDGTPTCLTRHTIPACMALIRPAHIADLIMRYNGRHD